MFQDTLNKVRIGSAEFKTFTKNPRLDIQFQIRLTNTKIHIIFINMVNDFRVIDGDFVAHFSTPISKC